MPKFKIGDTVIRVSNAWDDMPINFIGKVLATRYGNEIQLPGSAAGEWWCDEYFDLVDTNSGNNEGAYPTPTGDLKQLIPAPPPYRNPFAAEPKRHPGGKEADPTGRDQHTSGAKLDAGKVRPALVLGGFARALLEVSKVGTFGATKYTDNGWMEVPNGESRYDDAKLRHWLTEKAGKPTDPDTNLIHAAHEAWNALARLDLILREQEKATA